jgi:hypothetical protein
VGSSGAHNRSLKASRLGVISDRRPFRFGVRRFRSLDYGRHGRNRMSVWRRPSSRRSGTLRDRGRTERSGTRVPCAGADSAVGIAVCAPTDADEWIERRKPDGSIGAAGLEGSCPLAILRCLGLVLRRRGFITTGPSKPTVCDFKCALGRTGRARRAAHPPLRPAARMEEPSYPGAARPPSEWGAGTTSSGARSGSRASAAHEKLLRHRRGTPRHAGHARTRSGSICRRTE